MASDTFTLAGHPVRRVGYGAMQLPGPGVFGPPRDHDEAIRVLRRVVELGINHIDTSQFYGPDVANQLIREALHPYADDLVIVSKVGGRRGEDASWLPAQHPHELKAGVHDNLRTLGIDRLPVVNLRVMGPEGAESDHSDHVDPAAYADFDDQLAAMQELVDEGSLEAFGVSNTTTEQSAKAIEAGAVCVQNAYNLLHRDDDVTLGLCQDKGVAYVPFFPLGSAFPGMPKVTENATVQAVAERRGATASQIGLAWLLARADNILLIPGTSSVAHLDENTGARDVTLDADDLAELDNA
ncbi:oxidoreductase [Luteipulveratus halotolerans]|uniref:Oxidoreductase n=1 Tax=Luteipulveratus halotolerans TaxID=1631356 RepID=A0A0L6CLN3_9MICO|nr:oxidoreductase [Luteipulveratus halotolerans]KNX38662.1 oxidoreductase [Luteipulveratus halotolerans]